jgi:uncharacterized membrane protein
MTIPPTVPPSTPPPSGGGSYTPPPPPSGGPASSDRTLMVVLAYLWILALIPLIAKKEDREVQWHAKNGLVILGAEIILWILFTILGFIMPADMGLGCGMATLQCVVWIAFLVVRIIAIVKGVNNQRFRVPVISDFADKF